MRNIFELFEALSQGELSNLAAAVDGSGVIREEMQPSIVRYANRGLLRLYSRFLLSEKSLLLEMVEGITNYHLNSKYAESNWDPETVAYPYIKDGSNPFKDDVIKILAVYNAFGQALPLNDADNLRSLYTPQANVLQVPAPTDGKALSVVYQARHPLLSLDNPDQPIELPEVLHEALTAYIASKVYGAIGTQEALGISAMHRAYYEELCADAEKNDYINVSISNSGNKFETRGWV